MQKLPIKLLLSAELLWWGITAVVFVAVFWPIWQSGIQWPFAVMNAVFIAGLITFARHIFMLRFSLIGDRQYLKAGLILLMIPVVFLSISHLNEFMVYIEEKGWEPITGVLNANDEPWYRRYLWNEMLFFSVGTIISGVVLALRLFYSIWTQHNRGRV